MRGGVMFAALTMLATTGCDEAFYAGGASTVQPMYTTITQRDVRRLAGDERLAIELDGPYPSVIEFDGRRETIDFDRLELTTPDGESISMSIWLAHQAARHSVDLEGLPSRRFRLANDRDAGLGGLDEATPAPEFRSCESFEVAELDEVIAVMFVEDEGC